MKNIDWKENNNFLYSVLSPSSLTYRKNFNLIYPRKVQNGQYTSFKLEHYIFIDISLSDLIEVLRTNPFY